MAQFNNFFLPIALLVLFLSIPPSCAHNKTHNSTTSQQHDSYKGCFSKIYAFGDSFTDTGNAYFLGGFKSFFEGIISHSSYGFNKPTNRLSNGRLVIDFLSETLSLPYLPPYKDTSSNFSSGVNFAIAGSTSLSSEHFINFRLSHGHDLWWKTTPENFQTQINWFSKFIGEVECKGKDEKSCKTDVGNGLFWIGDMGVSDYIRTFGSSISARWLSEIAVGHVCNVLKTVLNKGGKYIVVQGLPPAGCLAVDLLHCPLTDRDHMGCSARANSIITAHNELLLKKIAEIQKQYSGCVIIYADYFNAYRTILANLSKYHFEEPFKACCGTGHGEFNCDSNQMCGLSGTSACKDPSKYISWDGMHLTEAMHQHLADLFFKQGFCKPSFDELIKSKMGASYK